MSNRKQRIDVGSTSSSSPSAETNKPRKRRFEDSTESDTFSTSNKSKDFNSMSQTSSTFNRFTKQNYSHQYFEIFNKRRQLPVWEYKDAFMATLDKNQVSFSLSFPRQILRQTIELIIV